MRYARLVLHLALAATLVAVLTHTRADPDLWGHVRFGGDMLAARTVYVHDRYSFASDRPWINHEWLAEIVMHAFYRAAGGFGLIVLKLALLFAMLAAVGASLRAARLPPSICSLLLGLVVVTTVPQANHVRPQLFSLMLFAWLLAALMSTRRARTAAMYSIPIMIVWANVHGGWIVGAGTLLVWAAASRNLKYLAVAAAAIAATILNPYGWRLWEFLRDTVGFSRPDIVDWQPITRLGPAYLALWSIAAAVLVVAIARGIVNRSLDMQSLAMPLILAAASLRVNRLQSFFAISVVMLMGRQLGSVESSSSPHPAASSGSSLRLAAAVVVALAIFTAGLTAATRNAGCIRIERDMFPEAGVVPVVDERGLRGRMLTWFGWGEYAIWHWGQRGISVSMDGRRETVYSDAAVLEHLRFYFRPDERHAILRRLRPDYIWLPADLEVTDRLQEDGWRPIFAGDQSVLLTNRDPGDADAQPEAAASMPQTQRCFPGP